METYIIPLAISSLTHFVCWLHGHHHGQKHGEELGRIYQKADDWAVKNYPKVKLKQEPNHKLNLIGENHD